MVILICMKLNKSKKRYARLINIIVLALLLIGSVFAMDSPKAMHSPKAVSSGIYLGAYGGGSIAGITQFQNDVGKKVAIAHVNFIPWGDYIQNWVGNTLNQAKSNGWVPMITVMPIADGQTANQFNNAYALSTFARGDHDVQARIWAQTLKGYGDPVLFRFAHEFNHGVYGWNIRNNGQTAQQYIDAWRHIHDVFIQEGATNVLWVWSPNVNWDGMHTFTEAYPGDAYVDWLGLDGYNWEGVNNTAAQTFHQIFDNSYNQITAISLKPLMIAETASHEVGIADGIHKKAVWITGAFGDTGIPSLPRIKAVLWYNYNYDNAIWVINSSPESKNAFAEAVCQVPIRQHF
jgi:hypothetical protein